MSLEQEIISAFQEVLSDPLISDEFIEPHENIMEIEGEIDHFKYVPAYMLWCLRNKDYKLVDMHTVNTLAEYGRTKMKGNVHLNFMWRCNSAQKLVVINFLKWCLEQIPVSDEKQIVRAIKNWEMNLNG